MVAAIVLVSLALGAGAMFGVSRLLKKDDRKAGGAI